MQWRICRGKDTFSLLLSSFFFLFGCQSDNSNKLASSNKSEITSESAISVDKITKNNLLPENQRICMGKDTWIDTSDLYKITQDKEDRKNRKDEIEVDGKKLLSVVY